MKVCLIGNSHVSMLVRTPDEQQAMGITVQVFAYPQTGPLIYEISENGTLSTDDPDICAQLEAIGQPNVVDLTALDAVAIVGMTATPFSVQSILADHMVHGWPASREQAEAARVTGAAPLETPLLSRAALSACLLDTIERSLGFDYVQSIRKVSNVPILIVRQPSPSERIRDAETEFPNLRKVSKNGNGGLYLEVLTEAHAQAFRHAKRLAILEQPPETLVQNFLTMVEFGADAIRLSGANSHDATDVLHANRAYGDLVWAKIKAAVTSLTNVE